MKKQARCCFPILLLTCLFVQALCLADSKKLSKSDRRWLEEEVGALLTEEELKIFMELDEKEDRKLFKKLFWARRDPDLMSPENEFKEEFEDRLKFVNRNFMYRGKKGATTDRGRVFLLLGAPDYSERGYEGELAEVDGFGLDPRAAREVAQSDDFSNERSDTASLHRPERGIQRMMWRYDPSPDEGIPSGLKIVLDSSPGFGFRFIHPDEMGQALAGAKLTYIYHPEIDYARDAQGHLMPLPARLDPNSPAKKVLREMMETKAQTSDVAFETQMAFYKSTEGAYIPLFFEIPAEHLKWKRSIANVTFFGYIETVDGQPVRQFEEQSTFTRTEDGRAVFEVPVQLEPGSYTFNLGVLDLETKKLGTKRTPVFVPTFKQDELDKSSVLLFSDSRRVEEPPGTRGHAFQFGQVKFTPRGAKPFRPKDDLGILFFLYGFGVDGKGQANLTSDYTLYRDGEKAVQIPTQSLRAGSTQAIANVQIPLAKFEPGNYQVEVQITDHVTGRNLSDRIEFVLEPEPYEVAEFSDLVESYRDGRVREAANALAVVPRASLRGATKKYRKASSDSDLLMSAACLHTDAAVSTLKEVPFHLKEARAYLDQIEDSALRTRSIRQWFLAVSYFFRSSTGGWGALSIINEALERYPDDMEIQLAVGSVYESAGWRQINGMLERAEGAYRGVVKTHPENVEAHMRLGRVLQLKQDWGGAIRELKWCVEHADDRANRFVTFMLLGETYYQLGDLPNTVRSYRSAFDLDPRCRVAAVALSHALHRSGDWASSREIMGGFLDRDDTSSNGPDEWKRFQSGRPEQLQFALQQMREDVLR